MVPRFKYNLIFMKLDIQSKDITLILNIPFGIDDLVPNFGPTVEVISDFMKFSATSKWNIRTDIHCLDS